MLSAGNITPDVLHTFEKACKGYFQNKDITTDKQVAKIMYSFADHRVEEWLDTDWDGLAALLFKDFMVKLRTAFLPTGWEDSLKSDILSMRQGEQVFWEWYNSMTVKNLLLKGTSSHMDLTKIREQLTANMSTALKDRVCYKHADKITDFEKWIEDIQRIDNY